MSNTSTNNLTPMQERCLRIFADIESSKPSLEEWAETVGIAYGTLQIHRRALIRAGMVTSDSSKTRSHALTDEGKRYVRKLKRRES